MKLDRDIQHREIQQISSADAMAAFFAGLGYNTEARTVQTPGNLGITADGTLQPIHRIELIADQEGLLQVYLFELKSVTVPTPAQRPPQHHAPTSRRNPRAVQGRRAL